MSDEKTIDRQSEAEAFKAAVLKLVGETLNKSEPVPAAIIARELKLPAFNALTAPISLLRAAIEKINKDNGWHEKERSPAEGIALIHSEVSELLEAFRAPNMAASQKAAGYSEAEEEAADILIRLLDFCDRHDMHLVGPLYQKLYYNSQRGYRHGGKKI